MLVAFGGLPGTGKSTIARAVAKRMRATYLRIDTIEQAIRSANVVADDVGPAGYAVAFEIAEANLRLGLVVVADSVNPLAETREAFRSAARNASQQFMEVELICSDAGEHRRRVETRTTDIAGLRMPTWDAVLQRHYEPWPEPHLILDTAVVIPELAVSEVCAALAALRQSDDYVRDGL